MKIQETEGLGELSYDDARAVEQALIEGYGLENLLDMRNEIAHNNPIYDEAKERGKEILRAIGFFDQ